MSAHAEQVAALEASPDWEKLEAHDQASIIAAAGIGRAPVIEVGDPAALLGTLDARSLDGWEKMLVALPGCVETARELAASKLQPTAVRVSPKIATLASIPEADAYLTALRVEILGHLDAGNPVII